MCGVGVFRSILLGLAVLLVSGAISISAPALVEVDVSDPSSVQAALEGSGWERFVLPPDQYLAERIRCVGGLQAAYPEIPTADIDILDGAAWDNPENGRAVVICATKGGLQLNSAGAEWFCGLLEKEALTFEGSRVTCIDRRSRA